MAKAKRSFNCPIKIVIIFLGLFLLGGVFSVQAQDKCEEKIEKVVTDERIERLLEKIIGEKIEEIIDRRLGEEEKRAEIIKETTEAIKKELKEDDDQEEEKDSQQKLIIKEKKSPAEKKENEMKNGQKDESLLTTTKPDKVSAVIINEVAWMGTEISSNDEWIELKNVSVEDIDLTDWSLTIKDKTIVLAGTIKANGFFLLERTDDESVPGISADLIYNLPLRNGGENLILKNDASEVVDQIEQATGWLAGDNQLKLTMERNEKGEWGNSCLLGGTPKKENGFGQDCGQITNVKFGDIRINEVFANPEKTDRKNEWVELYNSKEEAVKLKNWQLKDLTGQHNFSSEIIGAKEFLIIYPKIILNNGYEELTLTDNQGKIISQTEYEEAPEGKSWSWDELKEEYAWTSVVTPGKKNKIEKETTAVSSDEPSDYSGLIVFSELMPNPKGKDNGAEWLELFNNGKTEINLNHWKIKNQRGNEIQLKGKIKGQDWFLVKIKEPGFSLNNQEEKLQLMDGQNKMVAEVSYTTYAKSAMSYSQDEMGDWQWSRFATPGKKNRVNRPPQIKIKFPKKIYRQTKVLFSAKKTYDPDGDQLKFLWDFGDGQKSYRKEVYHQYKEKGKYQGVLKVSDGSNDFYQEFEVKVKKYPQLKIKIVGLWPNPSGSDWGKEKINLKNESRHKINLKNWKLATGREMGDLSQHTIKNDFKLSAGESKILYNDEHCRFNLLNQAGAVKLIYPDGTTADQVEYAKEKIAEDERYFLSPAGNWQWGKTKIAQKKTATNKQQAVKLTEKETVKKPEKKSSFPFWRATLNEKRQWCDGLEQMMINNWLKKNRTWIKILSHYLVGREIV